MPRLLGNGPLEFTVDGRQHLIPLSEVALSPGLTFTWPPFKALKPDDQEGLRVLVKGLIEGGVLAADTSGAVAPPKVAVAIKAAEAGPSGNNLEVRFANVSVDPDPSKIGDSTFDVTLSESETYGRLSLNAADPEFVGKVLGDGTAKGTRPGLVQFKSAAAATAKPLAAKGYKLEPATGKTVVLKDADDADKLTLEPRKTVGIAGAKIDLKVTPGADANTFGLTTSLVVTKNVKLSDLLTMTDFDDFVKFTSPGGGPLSAVPAVGGVKLGGGTSASDAQAASAVVVAGP